MPFSKYFQDDYSPTDQRHTGSLQFQLPAFIHTGPPTLAPGGGAEVLTFNSTWFANNNSSSNGYYSDPPPGLAVDSSICAPSPLGLPVYSASGFDILSILARVASRPSPRVMLGPVDMTCSFVVVDIRRHDQPIVYCSPTFCRLSGYPEHEVLGRNCRFLQAPPSSGSVRAGEPRRFTSQSSVDTMRKALVANKEVQTSIVNFRKDGSAFINLVSVIPILGGESGAPHELNDVVYHVGFQVDLTEQPNIILDKLRDGSYTQNTHTQLRDTEQPNIILRDPASLLPPPQRKQQLPPILMAPALSKALASPAIHRHLPITTSTTAPSPLPPTSSLSAVPTPTANSPLSLILLEYAPDFILVVSLKGAFLYVAPAVLHVLGHSPSDLVGRAISDLAHPEDVVPLERQLKESSTLITATNDGQPQLQAQAHAKIIDVLFRARTRGGSYVWVEARGRLHVEPGKGRKAIVLSARARRMPRVRWGDLLPSHGTSPSPSPLECWAQLSGLGPAAGAIVGVGSGVQRVLGYTQEDVLGRRISTLVAAGDREKVEGVLRRIEACEERRARVVVFVRVRMGGEEKMKMERVRLVFYPTTEGADDDVDADGLGIAPPVVLLHIARGDGIDNLDLAGSPGEEPARDPDENVFAELEVRRGSSWQYELQQMRFQNARLREEVRVMERDVRALELASGGTEDVYPPPPPTTDGNGVGEQETFGYDPQAPTEQPHANYTAALERYAEGTTYDQLDMALGMSMMNAGIGIGMGVAAGMAMGIDASYPTQSRPHSQQPRPILDRRPSFHHAQSQQTQSQPQSQSQQPQILSQPMYAPQPVHVNTSSGLLHALGPTLLERPHQQPQPRRPSMVRVPVYDPRSQAQVQAQGLERRRSDWGPMHPGVKRAFGGR